MDVASKSESTMCWGGCKKLLSGTHKQKGSREIRVTWQVHSVRIMHLSVQLLRPRNSTNVLDSESCGLKISQLPSSDLSCPVTYQVFDHASPGIHTWRPRKKIVNDHHESNSMDDSHGQRYEDHAIKTRYIPRYYQAKRVMIMIDWRLHWTHLRSLGQSTSSQAHSMCSPAARSGTLL